MKKQLEKIYKKLEAKFGGDRPDMTFGVTVEWMSYTGHIQYRFYATNAKTLTHSWSDYVNSLEELEKLIDSTA